VEQVEEQIANRTPRNSVKYRSTRKRKSLKGKDGVTPFCGS